MLVHATCKAFLTASLAANRSSYPPARIARTLLIELYASSAQTQRQCSHVCQQKFESDQRLSFVENVSTPTDKSLDWNQALQQQLLGKAKAEHENIANIFRRAVSDLEDRCEHIEQPLTEERMQRQALQDQYDKLNKAFVDLESEAIDRSIRFEALEAEKEHNGMELEASRAEVERLLRRTDELESRVESTRAESERVARDGFRAKESADVKHAAALARKEEEFDQVQDQLRSTTDSLNTKTEELGSLQSELQNAKVAADDIKAGNERLSRVDAEHRLAIETLTASMEELEQCKTDLETQLHDARITAQQAAEAHKTEMTQLEKHAAANIQKAEEDKAAEVAKLNEDLDELRGTVSRAHQDLDGFRETEQQQSARLQRRDRRVSELQKQVEKLLHEGKKKDRELAKASAVKDNVMALLGQGGVQRQVQPPTQLPYRPSLSSMRTSAHDFGTQEDLSPPTPCSGDDAPSQMVDTQASFASNTSSTDSRSGPTPKRLKPRREVRASIPGKPRLSTVSMRSTRSSLRGNNTVRRQPLTSISANRGGSKSAEPKTPSKATVDDLDDTTFEESEIFTGTAGRDMLDMETAMNRL